VNVKFCNGPAHGGEAVPLPLTEEYWFIRQKETGRHKAGEVRSPCRLCQSIMGQKGGTVECRHVLKHVQELENRCGSLEQAAEFSNVGVTTLYRIARGGQCTLQRETAAKLIRALDEKRREDRRNGYVHPKFVAARQSQARIEDRMMSEIE
jgi:hypothetical protein